MPKTGANTSAGKRSVYDGKEGRCEPMECDLCRGTGECEACMGSGAVGAYTCTVCEGTGECPNCDGSGEA